MGTCVGGRQALLFPPPKSEHRHQPLPLRPNHRRGDACFTAHCLQSCVCRRVRVNHAFPSPKCFLGLDASHGVRFV